MKVLNSLKQLTLGAVLSLALALLIIHPGMFATVEAQDMEGFYFQKSLVESIAPPEDENYTFDDPFYAGRPLYEGVATLDAACGGICWLIIGAVAQAVVGWALQKVKLTIWWAWGRARLASLDSYILEFEQWAERHNLADVVGKNFCKPREDQTKYAPCLAGEWAYLISVFTSKALRCTQAGDPELGLIGRLFSKEREYTFRPSSSDYRVWECRRTMYLFGSWEQNHKIFSWDSTPYLR